MAPNNAINTKVTVNADGFSITGGTTKRSITVTGGDVSMTGSGSAVITFPTSTATLATLALAETLSNKTLTAPKIASSGYIADANGNESLMFVTAASAVNYFQMTNSAAGASIMMEAAGEDTNISISLRAKGTGAVSIRGTSADAGELRIYEDTDNGTNYTGFTVGTQSADILYVMPTAVGAAGTFLRDVAGDGVLSWAAAGNVTKVGTPADNQMGVWTGDGTLEGTSDVTYNGTSFNIVTGKNFQIAGTTVLADSSGTTTLSGIDALDATTESTIEAAIDTLANLVSVGSTTAFSAGANFNVTTTGVVIETTGNNTTVPLTVIVDSSAASQAAFNAKNDTNFAHSGNIALFEMVNGSDSGDVVRINNAGTGHTLNLDNLSFMTAVNNFKIGGTAARGTTEGTNQLVLFNGTAPVGTLTNGVSIYSASGELRSMDAAGNSTLLSPHDHETNEWIYDSTYTPTGKTLRIDMERLMRKLDTMFGGGFIHEFTTKMVI